MVLAATALGFGAVWKSAAVTGTGAVRSFFGLADSEQLLGWVNLGPAGSLSRKSAGVEGPVDLSTVVTVVDADDRPFEA
jgi:hypothetical protein